jgi:hypothetical protein
MHAKKNQMPQLIVRQLEYESDTWKRLLGFMIEENIHLKNRLIEILNSISDKNLLGEMENFHSRFIKQDDLINLLRNDVVDLSGEFNFEIFHFRLSDSTCIMQIFFNRLWQVLNVSFG